MTETAASGRSRILTDDLDRPKGWFRVFGVLIANVVSWFDGFGTGPTNPGGRTIKVVDDTTGDVVLEFVEESATTRGSRWRPSRATSGHRPRESSRPSGCDLTESAGPDPLGHGAITAPA